MPAACWARGCFPSPARLFIAVSPSAYGPDETPPHLSEAEGIFNRTGFDARLSAGRYELAVLVHALEPGRREAFVLTQVLGLDYAEAAEVCGCPIGTIRSRVARARADLSRALAPEDLSEDGTG